MLKVHHFVPKLKEGEHYAQHLDAFFRGQGYNIEDSTREEQRKEIDRWFRHKSKPDFPVSIEYKADSRAAQTGNVFIETVSNDKTKAPGWALMSQSDYIIVYIPPLQWAGLVDALELRKALDSWKESYPTRPCRNPTYKSFGVCVPISVFADLTLREWHIPKLPASLKK